MSLMRCREGEIGFDGHLKEAAAERSPPVHPKRTYLGPSGPSRADRGFDSIDCKAIS